MMSLWSSVFGGRPAQYQPWSGDYFDSIARHVDALCTAQPLPNYEGPEPYAVVGQRELQHHTLYALRHPQQGLYALKVAGPHASPEVTQRLREEVSLLVGLSTTYHLPPYDVLEAPWADGGGATFTYYAGDLAARRAAGPLSTAELAHYALQLAAELVDVHTNGLLHLAIQPANAVIVRWPKATRSGQWFVFLAHFDLRGVRIGEDALPGLTPDAFSAPEQRGGTSVGIHTDLWGLGATLYFLCTGNPPPASGETASLELGASYPRWLTQLVATCLAPAPEQRPRSALALVDALLEHVRVVSDVPGAEGKKNGAAGPPEARAEVVIADRFLLMHANRLGKVPGAPVLEMRDLGWATRMKEANRLYQAGTASSLRRACEVLERTLGAWEEPQSLLGQFAARPQAVQFKAYEPPPRRIGNEVWSTTGFPVPIHGLWAMLDLYCKSLVSLVEECADPADIERMRTLCKRWLGTGSWGTSAREAVSGPTYPSAQSLAHIAQALRYTGELALAGLLIDASMEASPSDELTLYTGFIIARDRVEYVKAFKIAERLAAVAVKAEDFATYSKVFLLCADLAFRAKDYLRAKSMYAKLLSEAVSPEIENLACQVDCRLGSVPSQKDVERAFAVASSGRKLEQWFAAAEIAMTAGDSAAMQKAIAISRAEPRFRLPMDRWYHDELARLEKQL